MPVCNQSNLPYFQSKRALHYYFRDDAPKLLKELDSLAGVCVVYFDQGLGAAHSKRCVIFSIFIGKSLKKQEICSKILQKKIFLSLHQKAGRLLITQK